MITVQVKEDHFVFGLIGFGIDRIPALRIQEFLLRKTVTYHVVISGCNAQIDIGGFILPSHLTEYLTYIGWRSIAPAVFLKYIGCKKVIDRTIFRYAAVLTCDCFAIP